MTQGLNYFQQSPELSTKLLELYMLLKSGTIEQPIANLVQMRASQLNGSVLCLDLHVKQAKDPRRARTAPASRRYLARVDAVSVPRSGPMASARSTTTMRGHTSLPRMPQSRCDGFRSPTAVAMSTL
jgi:AhpD family alkylhydroperoxidase